MLRALFDLSQVLMRILFSVTPCALLFSTDYGIASIHEVLVWDYLPSYLIYGTPVFLILTLLNKLLIKAPGLYVIVVAALMAISMAIVLFLVVGPTPEWTTLFFTGSIFFVYLIVVTFFIHLISNLFNCMQRLLLP